MLTKRTIIGNIVGGIITAIGIISLISSFGVQITELDDAYEIGDATSYEFYALKGSYEKLKITGEAFEVNIQTPGDEIQDIKPSYKKEASFEWTVIEDGINRIEIKNTGESEIHVTGTLQYQTESILYAYHAMVIIAGVVIIGFSAGFSIRKPRGF